MPTVLSKPIGTTVKTLIDKITKPRPDIDKVKDLIKRLAVLNALNIQDSEGSTVLHHAVIKRSKEIVESLLQYGANVNIKDNLGSTVLHRAVNSKKIVELLLQYGANVNIKDNLGSTVLHRAVIKRSKEIVELLLQYGVDKDIQDDLGSTALHHAVIKRSKEIVESLLQYGVDKDIQDDLGYTALHNAAFIKNIPIVELLLQYGANVNIKDNLGSTVLHHAVNSKKIVELLLCSGVGIDIQDDLGYTALHNAALINNITIVELLLQYGANVNIKDNLGFTALDRAVLKGNMPMVKLTLTYNAEINTKDNQIFTTLHHAAFQKDKKILEMISSEILKVNPSIINKKNINNQTPLDILLLRNNFEALELFISKFKDFINQESIDSLVNFGLLTRKTDLVEKLLQNYGLISKEINSKTKELYEILEKDSLDEVDSKKVKELLSQPEIQESARELLEIEYNTNDTDSTLETTNTDLEEVQDGKSYWWEDPKSLHQYHQEQKRQKLKVQSPDLFNQKDLGSITWSIEGKQITVPVSKNIKGIYETNEGIIVKTTGLYNKEIFVFISDKCGIRESKKTEEAFIRAAAKGIKSGKLQYTTGIKMIGKNGFEIKINDDDRVLGHKIIKGQKPLYIFETVKNTHEQAKFWLRQHNIVELDNENGIGISYNREEDGDSKESKEADSNDRPYYTDYSFTFNNPLHNFEKSLEGKNSEFDQDSQ